MNIMNQFVDSTTRISISMIYVCCLSFLIAISSGNNYVRCTVHGNSLHQPQQDEYCLNRFRYHLGEVSVSTDVRFDDEAGSGEDAHWCVTGLKANDQDGTYSWYNGNPYSNEMDDMTFNAGVCILYFAFISIYQYVYYFDTTFVFVLCSVFEINLYNIFTYHIN